MKEQDIEAFLLGQESEFALIKKIHQHDIQLSALPGCSNSDIVWEYRGTQDM